MTANAAQRLIEHYVDNFRRLPWRVPPGGEKPDPYRVWLSEIMLQQTTVGAVIPRFERFLERWPTIEALAEASDEAVLSEWAGLGYYARARNLIACAREVAARSHFPPTAAELEALPGIGAYTSAAVAAIAFGEKAAAVDTNVARVIARLDGRSQPSRAETQKRVLGLMAAERPGDLLQALMDLGATLCTPKSPCCGQCPLRPDCAAAASGNPEAFPAPLRKRVRPHRYGLAWWTERDGRVWLVRRPPRGLLGGMAALPGTPWDEAQRPAPPALGTVRHRFTHFSLDLAVIGRAEPIGDGWWHPLDDLAKAGLPTLYRRAAEVALSQPAPARAAA